MRKQKQCRQTDARYWQRNAIAYYILWLITLAWTAWEVTAGREGFWWELASLLVPGVILVAAMVMVAALVGLYLQGRWY